MNHDLEYIKYIKYKQKYINLKRQIGGTFNKKVLILCHNRIVTGTFEPLVFENHPFDSYLQEILGEYNLSGIPKIDTVDLLPGGTYKADAFSDEFIQSHINEYDLVLVPDCAGPWHKLQDTCEIDQRKKREFTFEEMVQNIEKLIDLCFNLTQLVKPGGIIHFGKFISEDLPCVMIDTKLETFATALNHDLNEAGFDSQIKYVYGKHVIAVKPT